MTVQELKAKLPAPLQGFADTYGPVVLGWATADLQAWLALLLKGDVQAAYAQVLKGLGNQQTVDEWATINAGWAAANADNAARMEVSKAALTALLRIVLALALAAVDFDGLTVVGAMKEIAAMESKPWYLSKTIWGAVLGVAAGGLSLIGHGLSSDTQSWLADEVVRVIEAGVTVVGGVLAMYGRVKAETRIG